ncbi:MAG: hypothetical protein SWX82_04945, partial [Cyanobacteriota bacterium]|nr:hypothetical protein [Cyanobacteriota bacterium]
RKNNSESDFFVPEYFPTGCYLRVGTVVRGGKTQKIGRIILRVIFLFRNTFRPDATQGWGLWFEVGSWFLSQGWEDTESRKNNSESDFFVPEYFPTGC